jgi:hypothetical protein
MIDTIKLYDHTWPLVVHYMNTSSLVTANELKQFNQRYHYVRGPPPLPIGAFINHYRQQQVNGMTKHIDWTAGQHQKKGLPVLCSVVGLLGTCDDNDTNCLRFIDEISDTIIPTPLHIGEFITFHPSLPHSVPFTMRSYDRITFVLFY